MCPAEYVLASNADDILFPIPSGTDHELDYLLCSDIFATAWSSITSTGFQPGDTVAVYGAGPVGLLASYSALLRGALRVYSIDHIEARLHRAKSIGAIPIDLRKGDASTQILEHESEGVTRTSDCVGMECITPEGKKEEGYILNDAVKLTKIGGRICLYVKRRQQSYSRCWLTYCDVGLVCTGMVPASKASPSRGRSSQAYPSTSRPGGARTLR